MLCVTKMTRPLALECTKYMHVTATRCRPPEAREAADVDFMRTVAVAYDSLEGTGGCTASCLCVISPEDPEGLVTCAGLLSVVEVHPGRRSRLLMAAERALARVKEDRVIQEQRQSIKLR